MQAVLLIASGVISCYVFIIIFRILVSWFTGAHYGKIWDVLIHITEPYLKIFRYVRFLRKGAMDFSPILAILVLQVAAFILSYIAATPVISVVTIIAAIALAVWRTIFSIFVFFGLLVILRIASILFLKRPAVHFLYTIDSIIEPLTAIVSRGILRGKNISYLRVLIILFILLAIICTLGLFFIEPSLYFLLGWRTRF
jgi:YggT family protein